MNTKSPSIASLLTMACPINTGKSYRDKLTQTNKTIIRTLEKCSIEFLPVNTLENLESHHHHHPKSQVDYENILNENKDRVAVLPSIVHTACVNWKLHKRKRDITVS